MPAAASVPITEPGEVPTIPPASVDRQPASDSSASSAPISHDAPTTPPAPSTRPTRIRQAPIFGEKSLQTGPPHPPLGGTGSLGYVRSATHETGVQIAHWRRITPPPDALVDFGRRTNRGEE